MTARPPSGGSRRGGGYYLDDGPGDNPPPNLDAIADAEPRVEPYAVFSNRPYNVFGKDYVPTTADAPFKQRGIASWYGRKFHGQKTSSGEIYDMYAMTAAHPTLPIPSYARVTHTGNGRSVIVRINDRGPFHSNRVIDLSYAAANKLGYAAQGSAVTEVERLLPRDIVAGNYWLDKKAQQRGALPGATGADTAIATAAISASGPALLPVSFAASRSESPRNSQSISPSVPPPAISLLSPPTASAEVETLQAMERATESAATLAGFDPAIPPDLLPDREPGAGPLLSSISASPAPAIESAVTTAEARIAVFASSRGFVLQLGAFRSRAGADDFVRYLAREADPSLAEKLRVSAASTANGEWFRVQLGPYPDRKLADAAGQALRTFAGASYRPLIVAAP